MTGPQTPSGWVELSSGQNFTQEDVEMNRLWYQHSSTAHHDPVGFKGHDSFRFTLTDLDNESPAQSFFISVRTFPKGQRSDLLNKDDSCNLCSRPSRPTG